MRVHNSLNPLLTRLNNLPKYLLESQPNTISMKIEKERKIFSIFFIFFLKKKFFYSSFLIAQQAILFVFLKIQNIHFILFAMKNTTFKKKHFDVTCFDLKRKEQKIKFLRCCEFKPIKILHKKYGAAKTKVFFDKLLYY